MSMMMSVVIVVLAAAMVTVVMLIVSAMVVEAMVVVVVAPMVVVLFVSITITVKEEEYKSICSSLKTGVLYTTCMGSTFSGMSPDTISKIVVPVQQATQPQILHHSLFLHTPSHSLNYQSSF